MIDAALIDSAHEMAQSVGFFQRAEASAATTRALFADLEIDFFPLVFSVFLAHNGRRRSLYGHCVKFSVRGVIKYVYNGTPASVRKHYAVYPLENRSHKQ